MDVDRVDYWWARIEHELQKAEEKFPTWPSDPVHAAAVVNGEAGELVKAALECMYEPEKSSIVQVRKEAIQTAAMCLRFLVSSMQYEWTPGKQHEQRAS